MAVTDQQKLDFLLKKIGYTKTKTGSVVGTGAISGTGKQPFAEAIPSPLVVPNSSLWNEAASIPATAPGSDTTQVKVYLAASSGLRMTADATSSGQRAYIAYTTYNDTSSARLTNWIDTQFGASYLIKVYKGDPNSGGVALSAAGSGSSDGWFFDYSAGVLNFNDTSVPSGVTDTNIYIVGYRYIGQTGAPTSGISTFSYIDLTVERNLDVGVQGGISTFRNNIDLNADLDVDGHTNLDNVSIAGITTFSGIVDAVNTPASIRVAQDIQHKGDADTKISFPADNTISFDTAGSTRFGLSSSGNIELHGTQTGNNVATIYNGTGFLGFYASSNSGVNRDFRFYSSNSNSNESLRILSNGNVNVYKDLDVDGHTNLDNISVSGVSTFTGDATFSGNVSIGGTLTYEDVVNVDSVGIITAQAGIRVTGGVIEALAGENKIPSLYAAMGNLPSAGSYHGMFAHVHATGRGYFAHAGNWLELVNREINGVVGTGTETYSIGNLVSTSSTATSLNVSGVTTAVTVDINGDLDVDGHTNLDNVSIAGFTTITQDLDVDGHTNLDNVSVAGVSTFTGNIDADAFVIAGSTGTGGIKVGTSLQILDAANTAFRQQNNSSMYFDADNIELRNRSAGGYRAYAKFGSWASGAVGLFHDDGSNSNERLRTTSSGITVTGTVVATGADINGDLDVDGHTNLDNVSVAGVSTFAGAIDLNADLDVDGHTNLDNVSVAGVSTFAGAIDLNADLDVDGHTNLDNVSVAGVTSVASLTSGRVVTAGTGGKLQDSSNLTFDGSNLFVSGINITGGGATSILGADIVTRNFKATGISTFEGNSRFNSTIAVHDGTTGANGQYLRATGAGVTWANFPTMRTGQTFTASAGQTTFSFTYNVGFLDVYVNGIKLSSSEFTATNGSSVVLAVGCFVGDIVELVSFFTTSYAAGSEGGGGLSNVVEDTSPQLGGNLDLFNKSITGTGNVNITGIISATSFKGPSGVTATFIGDGSGLTNVIGSGSGVVVKDDGSVVGTAGTIDFGQNISVTPISAGIVTVGVTSASLDINKLTVTGITTFVGITTFNNTVSFRPPIGGKVNFFGSVEGKYMRWQNNGSNVGLYFANYSKVYFGDDSRTQIDPHGNGGSNDHFRIWQYRPDGKENQFQLSSDFINIIGAQYSSHQSRTIAKINYDDGASFYHHGHKKIQTSGVGVTITSQLDVTNLNVSGVTTTSDIRSNSLNLKNAAGSATYAIFTNGGSALLKHNNTDRLETSASGVTVTGTVAATAYTGDGSQLTGITGVSTANVRTNTLNVIGVSTLTNIDVDDFIDVGTNIQLGNAGVVTATTFVGAVTGNVTGNATGLSGNPSINVTDLGVDGHTNLDNVNIVGVTTTAGHILPQDDGAHDLGLTGTRWRNVYADNFVGDGSGLTGVTASGSGVVIKHDGNTVGTAGTINFSTNLDVSAISAGIVTVTATDTNTQLSTEEVQDIVGAMFTGNTETNITATYQDSDGTIDLVASGGGGGTDVGITTNLSGSFTASAGSAATINTFTGYSANDLVVEYTIYIKNGSDFQTQKLLAMRDGTTIHSTQFAVMFSSSLLVQCDATISSGNILLRATPETGVSGSTTYKIKREVM